MMAAYWMANEAVLGMRILKSGGMASLYNKTKGRMIWR
jgi:hypothetical protein